MDELAENSRRLAETVFFCAISRICRTVGSAER